MSDVYESPDPEGLAVLRKDAEKRNAREAIRVARDKLASVIEDGFGCPDCSHHYGANAANIIGACASVGIEHGKSTQQMFVEYFAAFHASGHTSEAKQ